MTFIVKNCVLSLRQDPSFATVPLHYLFLPYINKGYWAITQRNMTNYELMFILLPDLGEKKTTEEINEVKNLIKSNGGEIFHEDVWGIRDLAYRIKRQDQGYYVVLNLKMDGKGIPEIEHNFNINQAVMRYMFTKTPVGHEIMTLEQYEAAAALEEAEKEKEKAEKEASQRKPAPSPAKKAPVKKEEVKAPAPAKEAPAKEAAPKDEPKKEKSNLEDVDAKLKSIIDDPDISL